MNYLRNSINFFVSFLCLIILISCDKELSENDIENYKKVMDVRLGHLGNALIMQGRLIESHNLNSFRADEDHFKEAEEIIKDHLEKLGRPDELKALPVPNVKKIKDLHSSIIESSELMISAVSTLEDQAWLGGSVGYAESALDKARFNFQNVIKVIYKPEEDVKPLREYKEYDVGDRPEDKGLN